MSHLSSLWVPSFTWVRAGRYGPKPCSRRHLLSCPSGAMFPLLLSGENPGEKVMDANVFSAHRFLCMCGTSFCPGTPRLHWCGEGFLLHSQWLTAQRLHADVPPEPWPESFPIHISLGVSHSGHSLGSCHQASVRGSGDMGLSEAEGPCLHMTAAPGKYFLFTEFFFVTQGTHLHKLMMLRFSYNSQRTRMHSVVE